MRSLCVALMLGLCMFSLETYGIEGEARLAEAPPCSEEPGPGRTPAACPHDPEGLERTHPSYFDRKTRGIYRSASLRGGSLEKVSAASLRQSPKALVEALLDRTRAATGAPMDVEIEITRSTAAFPGEIDFQQVFDGVPGPGIGNIEIDSEGNIEEFWFDLIDESHAQLTYATLSRDAALFAAKEALRVALAEGQLVFIDPFDKADLIYRLREDRDERLHPYWTVKVSVGAPVSFQGDRYASVDAVSAEVEIHPPPITICW